MNTRMIQKLRRKFILVAMLTYFLVVVFMGTFINISNFMVSSRQIRAVLDYIFENDGIMSFRIRDDRSGSETAQAESETLSGAEAKPAQAESETLSGAEAKPARAESEILSEAEETLSVAEELLAATYAENSDSGTAQTSAPYAQEGASGKRRNSAPDEGGDAEEEIDGRTVKDITGQGGDSVLEGFSPEFHYSARYFTATFTEEGEIKELRTTHINELTPEEVSLVARAAYRLGLRYGRLGYYYFKRGINSSGDTMIVLLNCAAQINSNARILNISLLIGAVGLIITFLLVYIFSHRVVQPEIENIRKQKQFITNASHELKTPLAVIRANTEIEEMMNGESEWTQSTMRQVDRLDGLVQNLVMISRAAEREDRSIMVEIDVTKNVEESVNPYRSLAQQDRKELILNLQRDVRMVADESKIRQLTTLLVDNAFKYCDNEGSIKVSLDTVKKGKTVRLTVSNSFAEGANVDYSRFFERFYREDESHNVDKGGYGIGLSIAESICQQYGGSIQVSWKNGEIFFTCLLT